MTSGPLQISRVQIAMNSVMLTGELYLPEDALGVVAFAQGDGSSHTSPRNRAIARILRRRFAIGTFLVDLLTSAEDFVDRGSTGRFCDVDFLAKRLSAVASWLRDSGRIARLPLGYLGSNTGAAAAIVAAADFRPAVSAVVSRGGR